MDLSNDPAFSVMSETIVINDEEYQAIYDPIERDEKRILGGRENSVGTNVYIKKTDIIPKVGDRLEFTQNEKAFKGRILQITDDDTNLIVLQVTGLLTGVVPRV
jgi:hypothetical protein